MAAIKQLAAVTRSGTGKGAARSVRREGRVPGVIYGGGEKAGADLGRFQGTQQAHLRRPLPDLDLRARDRRPQGARPAARLSARRRHRQAGARRLPPPQRRARACASACPCTSSIASSRPASRRAARSISCCTPSNCWRRRTRSPSRSPSTSPVSTSTIPCMSRPQAARGLPARRHQGRLHRRDHRAADGVPGRGAGRRRDFGAAPAAAPPPPPGRRRRGSGQGRRRRSGQGRRRRAGQAGRQEVTRRPRAGL